MSIAIHDKAAIEILRRKLGIEPQRLRRLRTAFFKKSRGSEAALAELPDAVREAFARQVELHPLAIHSRHDSQLDGATKLVLRTDEGYLIESVLLRAETGRTSLCVSSQVGCAAACGFCATGRMGIAHNLSAAEILDQVVWAGEFLAAEGRRVRNIVLMGMGEPFHNEEAVYEAITSLLDASLFHHTPGRILVSTVGLPEAMIRCARRFPDVHLALSLHSVRQEVREELIPLAARYPLDVLRRAAVQVNAIQSKSPLMIEYLMLAGVNDAADDARRLAEWLAGLRVHVNLIPFNAIDGRPDLKSTPRPGRDAFAGVLKASGITTTIRYSMGADIAAACGQLVQRENREVGRRLHSVV